MLEPVLGYKSAWRVLTFFAEAPKKEYGRAFLREQTLLGNQALDNALRRLVAAGILLQERNRYRLDLGNETANLLLQLIEKERARLRHLDYRFRLLLAELLRKLFDAFADLELAYLFGSHARGTARETSDIDVALIFSGPPKEVELVSIADWASERFATRVQLHAFSRAEFGASAVAKQVYSEGIPLLGKGLS